MPIARGLSADFGTIKKIAAVRFSTTGNPRYRKLALQGMKYLVAVAAAGGEQLLPDILLADREMSNAPIHIAIVGGKQDAAAQSLHTAALRYPADYLQIDWLDRAEGELPNRDIPRKLMK